MPEKTILIADDSLYMRMTLKNVLTSAGYTVVGEAVDGSDAVMKYTVSMPMLVMLDITMPNMDGISAARYIKEKYPAAKIIMCSAMGQQSMVIDAVRAGASDFVVKPFQSEKILEAVKKAIGDPPEKVDDLSFAPANQGPVSIDVN